MKKATAVVLVMISMIAVGCKQAAPPANVDAIEDGAATQSEASPSAPIALDAIDTKLGMTAYIAVDKLNNVVLPAAGTVIPVNGENFEIAGFAVDEAHATTAAGVVILIDGQPYVAEYGGERADIAAALNNPDYLHSQFWAKIPTGSLSKGPHDVSLRVVAADSSGYYEGEWTGKISIE